MKSGWGFLAGVLGHLCTGGIAEVSRGKGEGLEVSLLS